MDVVLTAAGSVLVVIGALAGGTLLVLVGVLMATGIWTAWIYQLQNLAGTFTTPV